MKSQALLFAIAAAACMAIAAPAAAEDRYQTRVAYGDLNLAANAGADAFLNRMRSAARATCGDERGRMSLRAHRRARACNTAFVQEGVIELGSPLVSQRYLQRGGRLPDIAVAAR